MGNTITDLSDSELKYIEKNMLEKCETCGHLEIFHSEDDYCEISDCTCIWGELREDWDS